MLKIVRLIFPLFWLVSVTAQETTTDLWQPVNESFLVSKTIQIQGQKVKGSIFQLDRTLLKKQLAILDQTDAPSVSIPFPLDANSFANFRMKIANTLHPALLQQFPTIRTYEGVSDKHPSTSLRMEISHKGVFVMLWEKGATKGLQAIQPNKDFFILYNKKDLHRSTAFHCETEETVHYQEIRERLGIESRGQTDGVLRTYRLALACTGEYTQFHGGTVADALAAMATTMNRVNGIYKRELSIELQIVPNNDKVIYLNGEEDPFKNDSGSQMLTANQEVCDQEIGIANYDIGHAFSTGHGGVAYLNSACFDVIKAGGVTGQPMPIGDPYDVDYVAHEMGHQFGATHTQNNDCNRSFASAFEPGSGSTIMSYSGTCFPNVQDNSDPYFHGYSLQQIAIYLGGVGNTCAVTTPTNNNPPAASAGRDYFMPIGTPFELTGSGEDEDAGQELTYNWEQMDNETATMPPMAMATEGPSFRSLSPKDVPNRYFPSMEWLLSEEPSEWEVLPLVGRTMKFRLTVRDNMVEGGCSDFDEMEIVFLEEAGPFKVKIPSEPIFYSANSTQTIRWEVASTDEPPVNVRMVDILLSTDGGHTYPIVLAENVKNDGSHKVQFPNIITDSARVKIKGVNHILFDISDHNFSIVEATPDFDISVNPSEASVCRGNAIQFTIEVSSIKNFFGAINLGTNSSSIFPNMSFSNTTPQTGENSILTINSAGVPPGNYTIEVTGINGERIKSRFIELSISPNEPVILNNVSPADQETDLSLQPTFEWTSTDATATYLLQVATDASFNNIILEESDIEDTQFAFTQELEHSKTYFWRVQAVNKCNTSAFSEFTHFTISNTLCTRYASADIPEIIPDKGTPEISSIIQLQEEGVVKSIRVLGIEIEHTWINDLTTTLQSPDGTKVILFDKICGSEDGIDLSFGMDGIIHSPQNCPPSRNDVFQPKDSLTILEGEPIAGTWTLLIKDHFNMDGGQLHNWGLEVCRIVKDNIPLNIVINEQSNPSCAGGNDGFIIPSIQGGTAPYAIQWNNGEERLVIENLTAGTYSVTVTDGEGSTATAQVRLTAPTPINISSSTNAPKCANSADGNIILNVTGGNAPYQYNWSHGAENASIANLSAGDYTVTVTDANKCESATQIELEEPSEMSLAFQTTNIQDTESGSIDLTVTGGRAPYVYRWSNNLNSRNIAGLTAGVYTVTVTDAIGCTTFGQANITSAGTINCQNVTVEITLDNYGSETSWDIKNSEGIVFAQGGPYENFTREEVQTASVCLVQGCYDFTIYDQWGDGICCNYGNGQFEVTEDALQEILVSGSKFEQQSKTTFCVSGTNSESEILSYCGASGKNTVYEWIEKVTINNQDFQTGSNGGYFNNGDIAVDVPQNSTLQASFTSGFGFNSYSENWQVWIDWNRDGDLEDAGEMVFFGSGDRTVNASIEVPAYAVLGTTKMRVAMKWGNQVGPCETFNWGEVEDFTLNIVPSSGVKSTEEQSKIGTEERISTREWNVFPNPVSNKLHLDWSTTEWVIQRIFIYNNLGEKMSTSFIPMSSDNQQASISVNHLPNGLYFVQLEGAEHVVWEEFIVTK